MLALTKSAVVDVRPHGGVMRRRLRGKLPHGVTCLYLELAVKRRIFHVALSALIKGPLCKVCLDFCLGKSLTYCP